MQPNVFFLNARKHIAVSQITADRNQPSCSVWMCFRGLGPSRRRYWSVMHDILFPLVMCVAVSVTEWFAGVCFLCLICLFFYFRPYSRSLYSRKTYIQNRVHIVCSLWLTSCFTPGAPSWVKQTQQFANRISAWNHSVCVCSRTAPHVHICMLCVHASASARVCVCVASVCSYSMCVCQHHRSISHGVSWKLTTG